MKIAIVCAATACTVVGSASVCAETVWRFPYKGVPSATTTEPLAHVDAGYRARSYQKHGVHRAQKAR